MANWDFIDYFILLGTVHLTWLMLQMLGGLLAPFFQKKEKPKLLVAEPPDASVVLLIVPVCNENPNILESTLQKCQVLSDVDLVVLENSSNLIIKASLEQVCEKLGVRCYSIENLGNKARALNHYLKNHTVTAEFVSVLDVDQEPEPEFLETILPHFQGQEDLGLVQTPQAFRNEKKSWLTFVYAAMQAIFFRGVCVARGRIGFTPCLGTNFVMRLSALRAVGGFDENSQTEDVATSLKVALAGYRTQYLNQVLVYGLVPNRFRDILKQMKRYTIGSNQILGKIFGRILWQPKHWSKVRNWLTIGHYLHYSSTLLVGSFIFYLSFFSDHVLVEVNLVIIGIFLLIMLVWLPFYKMLTGLLFFTIILPFTLIFNLDITAYNRKFAVTGKQIDDLEETEGLVLKKIKKHH
ncbi:MAG TPA: glycosyltransferase family 2 protein [Saprospiraceae bacterium]|nr:glycosyltransferase family 2 protein [Saprospiraceae bacterium]